MEAASLIGEPGSFVVSERGVSFVFSACEIDACASGDVESFFKWRDLERVLNSDLALSES